MFVSKGRFQDAQNRIATLEADKLRLEAEVDRLNSYIAWRFGGAPTHPEIDPRPEWMKSPAVTQQPTPEKEADPNDIRAQAIRATGSRNPRVIAEWISRHNESSYRSSLFAVPSRETVPTRPGVIATKQEKEEMADAARDLESSLGTDRSA